MRPTFPRRVLPRVASAFLLAAILIGGGGFGVVWLSFPSTRGVQVLDGLTAPARLSFDAIGVPHIRAEARADAFAALGYASARDRLFQMDLLRRSAAGRLSEAFGAGFERADEWARLMNFSGVADAIFARLPEAHKSALVAYAAGVNQIIRDARVFPLEFALARYQPEIWRPEDSVLALLRLEAMLSDTDGQERVASAMRVSLPEKVVTFLTPESDCYAALLAHDHPAHCPGGDAPLDEVEQLMAAVGGKRIAGLIGPPMSPQGSNGWVVAPQKTRDGRALLANDMHLALSAPNLWYRADMQYGDARLVGLTIPGIPLVLSGSNERVAWGLTNLRADVYDLVTLEPSPSDPARYRTPDGERAFTSRIETIKIRGGADKTVELRETIWGPVASEPLLGRPVAVHWTVLDPAATDFDLLDVDGVNSVSAAQTLFRKAGGPPLNVLLADRDGNIGWTLMGRLPKRRGMDGLFSESWADGARGWAGYVAADELPGILNPAAGFIVNTNQRTAARDQFKWTIGHEFQGGFRAWRATERLEPMKNATEADMLALQLDTATEFYRYYQRLALSALENDDGTFDASSDALRRYIEGWDGRADTNSRALPLLVEFVDALNDAVLAPVVARCREADPHFVLGWAQIDEPVRRIVESRRPGLLPDKTRFKDWRGFLRNVVLESAARLREKYGFAAIDDMSWGKVNVVEMAHPLSAGAGPLGFLLDMPRVALPGCAQCVRYSESAMGANARFVVSPGFEKDGVLEMAGGQSGQPLSAHYADQQEGWVSGRADALVRGERSLEISLQPRPQ